MAEAVQRIIVGRALAGEHPRSQAEVIDWLEETVVGLNAAPTNCGMIHEGEFGPCFSGGTDRGWVAEGRGDCYRLTCTQARAGRKS